MNILLDATSFTGDGLSNWDTSSVTTLSFTFSGATSFTGDGLSNWDTSSVTTLHSTFYGATSFTGDGLSNWDTSSVTNLYWNILRCDLVHGRWIVKLGYVECDEFVNQHSTVRPRSRETECQIGIRRG